MSELIFLMEGGYVARALGESILTEADSLIVLRESIRDTVKCHFDDLANAPRIIRMHYVRDEVFAI